MITHERACHRNRGAVMGQLMAKGDTTTGTRTLRTIIAWCQQMKNQ